MILRPVLAGLTDHGGLNGLGDDDHAQYHNDARGDARYYTETELDAGQLDNRYYREDEHIDTSAGAGDSGKPIVLDADGQIDESMLNDGDIDHGALTGLTDDDHVAYLRIGTNRGLLGNRLYIGTTALGDAYFEMDAQGRLTVTVKGVVEQRW